MAFNPLSLASTALFLEQYIMEAVGFTEFIYEEACQQGLRVLKQMKKKKAFNDIKYMARKYEENVLAPAWAFHCSFGPLNPYTYRGFEVFYQNCWKELDAVIWNR